VKTPAFQFYATDYLSDANVQMMTLEEEGAYIRLLCFCWIEGSIPNDPERLARLCKGGSTTLLTNVLNCFTQDPNDPSRLVHKRLEQEREKQRAWREKSAQGGRRSAHKRKTPKTISAQQGGSSNGQAARLKGGDTFQSSSSSSSSIVVGEPRATVENFLVMLKADPKYQSLNIDIEHAQAEAWTSKRNVRLTRQFFIDWLDRSLKNEIVSGNGNDQVPHDAVWHEKQRQLAEGMGYEYRPDVTQQRGQ